VTKILLDRRGDDVAGAAPTRRPTAAADPVGSTASRIARLLATFLRPNLPITIRAWDGSHAAVSDSAEPVHVTVHSTRAVRYLLASADQLGLARAYVSGALTVDGDLDHAIAVLFDELHPRASGSGPVTARGLWRCGGDALIDIAKLWGWGPPPRPPAVEAQLRGRRHSRLRDAAAIRHHYDVGNDFYRLLLGPSMTYSCAYWPRSGMDLQQAQQAKHELVAAKLGLQPGQRVLDIGCGWGSFLIHAATRYGVHGHGVTLSAEQQELARERVRDAGVEHLVTVERRDYRDLPEVTFDAVASVGMAEHVGTEELDAYARRVAALLVPEGRLLHHTIATRQQGFRHDSRAADTFINRYVFPDGQLQPPHTSVRALECAGLEVRDEQALREHYPSTLRAWTANLRREWHAAVSLVGLERARVWELYMTACAVAFDRDRLGVNQVLPVRPTPDGNSGMPRGAARSRAAAHRGVTLRRPAAVSLPFIPPPRAGLPAVARSPWPGPADLHPVPISPAAVPSCHRDYCASD